MTGEPMKFSDFTEEQQTLLRQRLSERSLLLDNGCIVPSLTSSGVLRMPDGSYKSFAQFVWLMVKGASPNYRLRTTCRTVGCCNIEHLEDIPPRQKVKPTLGRHMTDDERTRAMELYKQRMRLQDIANVFGVSAQTIHKLVHRSN